MSWSPNLLSGSGPVGLPPVPWTEKNNWKVAIFRPTRRSLLPRRTGRTDNLRNFFLSSLQKLEQRAKKSWYLDILLTVHLSIIYSLFPTWYTAFLFTYNNCYLLSSTCFKPHRPIIRRSKLYMQPMVFSPSADVFVVRPLRKNSVYWATWGVYWINPELGRCSLFLTWSG